MPRPLDGTELLRFLRDAYGPPQTEQEQAAQFAGDLVEFVRDFSSSAFKPVVARMSDAEYNAPRRVLLSEGTGRRRAPVALASLAAASSLRALRPTAATHLRVPPYVAELSARARSAGSEKQLAEVAS